jgi:hypothetical protein
MPDSASPHQLQLIVQQLLTIKPSNEAPQTILEKQEARYREKMHELRQELETLKAGSAPQPHVETQSSDESTPKTTPPPTRTETIPPPALLRTECLPDPPMFTAKTKDLPLFVSLYPGYRSYYTCGYAAPALAILAVPAVVAALATLLLSLLSIFLRLSLSSLSSLLSLLLLMHGFAAIFESKRCGLAVAQWLSCRSVARLSLQWLGCRCSGCASSRSAKLSEEHQKLHPDL